MARFNEILVGRYNRFAQKFFSMKGGAALPTLNPDLGFVLPLFHGIENRYLEGWGLFSTDVFQPAPGAGNTQLTQVRNPVGSNVIAVVTRWQYAEGAATNTSFLVGASLQLNRGPIATDYATLLPKSGWDARDRPAATCIVSTNPAAGVIPGGGQGISNYANAAFVNQEMLPPPLEIVLLPGSMLLMIAGNANTQGAHNVWWRERYLEDSERA